MHGLSKVLFGYQYKQAEYEDGGLNTDYRMHGPMAGFSFRFQARHRGHDDNGQDHSGSCARRPIDQERIKARRESLK